jgi:hypothetical protein
MEIIPYSCIRCGYTSKNKTCMRRHFKRDKMCSPIKNDIELTEEIIEIILNDRFYKIPKKIKIEVEKIESPEYRHYFYLVREKDKVEHCENIYKLGKNKTKEYLVNVSRLFSYGIGTEIILILECVDSLAFERIVLKEFREKFQKYKFGTESFIGNKKEMVKIILRLYTKYNDDIENNIASDIN